MKLVCRQRFRLYAQTAEAETLVQQARANGSISSVEGTANEFAAQKQAREQAYHEWRMGEITYTPPPDPAFDVAQWKQQDYAESAHWEQQQAYQRYRQGEWAKPQPQKKSFWQKAGEWLQQKVVQPVQQAAGSIVNALKPPQTAGTSKLAAPKMPVPKPKVHSSGDIIFPVVVLAVAIVIGIDSSRRHGISAAPTCTSSYAACFENLERLPLKNGQSLDRQQFDEMLDAIHDDLKGGWRTPFDPARMNYDTPF